MTTESTVFSQCWRMRQALKNWISEACVAHVCKTGQQLFLNFDFQLVSNIILYTVFDDST